MKMESTVSIIILAAGLGTRMRSRRAKVLHEAGGLTLVEHVVRTATSCASPENIVVVTGHQSEQVQSKLRPYGVKFALQAEQKGTGHAVLCCRELVAARAGLTAILYGDCPLLSVATLRALIEQQTSGTDAATLITTDLIDPTGYGRILVSPDGGVQAIVEQKAASAEELLIREINSGIYCFGAASLWNTLERVQPNPSSGEYYLTDVAAMLHEQGKRVGRLKLADPNEILGINTRIELAVADRILRTRKAEELMLSGVTIERPETVMIDPLVEVGQDTVIEPFAQLLGSTIVGSDCRVGACSILKNVRMADESAVLAFCHIEDSELGQRAKAGPYSRIRMGARVGDDAHVGNFVELKKTTFGKKSKAMHLAYLGDSQIGERVNIGAGTITCNYDGAEKHPTHIGDYAFVGSNSTLIAPLTLGAGSYIAAGSVINQEVPADAMSIGRSRQEIKEGWAKARRARMKSKDA